VCIRRMIRGIGEMLLLKLIKVVLGMHKQKLIYLSSFREELGFLSCMKEEILIDFLIL